MIGSEELVLLLLIVLISMVAPIWVCVRMANKKNRSPGVWGLLGFCFSWLGVIALALLPSRNESVPPVPETSSPPPKEVKQPAKTKINAKAVVQDIRAGMADVGLMQKYGLSAKQLAALYKKLEDAGLLNKT